jgi:hypothetical protein
MISFGRIIEPANSARARADHFRQRLTHRSDVSATKEEYNKGGLGGQGGREKRCVRCGD